MLEDEPDAGHGHPREPVERHCHRPLRPGVWTGFGEALRPAVGRIHWAGAEYAVDWNGYMEGAVRSGRATAEEVLAAARVPAPAG